MPFENVFASVQGGGVLGFLFAVGFLTLRAELFEVLERERALFADEENLVGTLRTQDEGPRGAGVEQVAQAVAGLAAGQRDDGGFRRRRGFGERGAVALKMV